MNGYKIALIVEEIDQSYQSEILNGIASAAKEFSLDISAFISFSASLNNEKHDTGEFNIFNLPDFNNFDGAILLTNTLAHQPVISDILERIKSAGIPAVSIDNDIPYLYYIGIDNKTAMRNITEHLINVHGFSDFRYISGPADNPESADRLSAFIQVLDEYNIPFNKENIFYGDFRSPSGRKAVEYFIEKDEKMPEAIICANDVMAASAINRLTEEGYSVPRDIAVTGFDNTYINHNYQLELTSVDRPLAHSGRLACKILYNHFIGTPQGRSVILNMSTRFTESCGCSDNLVYDINEFRELNYRNYNKFERTQNFMSNLNKLSTSLLSCNTFEEYIGSLKKFTADVDPDEFYLCLCDNWSSELDIDILSNDEKSDAKSNKSYTNDILVPICYKNGKFYDVNKIQKNLIIPNLPGSNECGRFYYHIPLHFGERCFGYMVILNSPLPLHNSMFETFCINLSNSLENIRKLLCLEYAVNRLGRLYAWDTFSGIYNRNGFVQATESIFNDCISQQREIMLMFIDLDGLKKINDTYGHSVGDRAICSIADILTESCTDDEIYCRFGGDEFIVFAADYTDQTAKKLYKKINTNINKVNESKINPFELSASIGYVITMPKKGEDIFRFVTDADNIMYTEKRKKKLSRYLKS